MNMKIATLFLAAVAGTTNAQLVFSTKKQLRALSDEQEDFPSDYLSISMPSSMSMAFLKSGRNTEELTSAMKRSKSGKSRSSKSSKACDVFGPDLGTAAACYLEIDPKLTPEDCDPLLTPDFLEYLAPSADCLLQAAAGDPRPLFGCLGCLIMAIGSCDVEEKVCVPATSIIQNLCGGACYTPAQQECESAIQTGLLCVTSSPYVVGDDGIEYGGMDFGPHYECSAL